jgi:hypothetical protein
MDTATSIELRRKTIVEKRGNNGLLVPAAAILIASAIGLSLWMGIFLALISIF